MTDVNVNYTLVVGEGFTVTGGVILSRVPCVGEEIQIHDSPGNVRDCVVHRVVHVGSDKTWARAWVALGLKERL